MRLLVGGSRGGVASVVLLVGVGRTNAGPSAPLKYASLRMTGVWLGEYEEQMQVPFAASEISCGNSVAPTGLVGFGRSFPRTSSWAIIDGSLRERVRWHLFGVTAVSWGRLKAGPSAPLKCASLRMTGSYCHVTPRSFVVQVVPSAASALPDCAVWKWMWVMAC